MPSLPFLPPQPNPEPDPDPDGYDPETSDPYDLPDREDGGDGGRGLWADDGDPWADRLADDCDRLASEDRGVEP